VEKLINTDTFPCQLNSKQHCLAGKLVFKFQKLLGVAGAPIFGSKGEKLRGSWRNLC